LGTGSKRANSSAGERPGAKAHFVGSEARILLIVAVKATSGAMEDGPQAALARAGAIAPGVGGAKAAAAARFCESHASCSARLRLRGSLMRTAATSAGNPCELGDDFKLGCEFRVNEVAKRLHNSTRFSSALLLRALHTSSAR
jgi:hypothetical protein